MKKPINPSRILPLLIILTLELSLFASKPQEEQLTPVSFQEKMDAINSYLLYNPDSAFIELQKLDQNNELSEEQLAKVYIGYAAFFLSKHKYDSTYSYCEKALQKIEDENHPSLVSIYNILGKTHYMLGEHEESFEALIKALDLAVTQDPYALPGIYLDISNVYLRLGNWPKTEEYLHKALEEADSVNHFAEYSFALGNLGMVYGMQEKWDSSIMYFERSLELNENAGNDLAVSKNTNNLGVLHEHKGDLPKALEYYTSAFEIAKRIDDKASIAIGYQNIGHTYSKMERYNDALPYFERGIQLSKKLGNLDIVRDGLFNLSTLYENLGQYKKALDTRTEFLNLNDSLVNLDRLNAISELEIKYETEKKQRENLELRNTNLEQDARIASQRTLLTVIILGSMVIIALLLSLYFIQRQRRQNKHQLELLRIVTETQEEERQRFAADLHDSVGSLLASLKVSLQHEGQNEKAGDSKLQIVDRLSEDVRSIAHNMMPATLKKYGLPAALQEELRKIEESSSLHCTYTDFGMEERLDKQTEIHIFRIAQEIMQNAVKHALASELSVQLTNDKKMINLLIEDNGKGFNPKQVKHSFGLANIESRIKFLAGSWELDSSTGRGSLVNLSIPCAT